MRECVASVNNLCTLVFGGWEANMNKYRVGSQET